MKEYSVFSGLWRAPLFLKAFYVDVGLRWRGVGIWNLILLEFITWLILFIPATISFSHFIDNDMAADLKDFPPITLKAGVASSPVAQPYIMKTSTGVPIFAFDTTGVLKNPADAKAMFLVTDTEYVQDDGRGSIRRTSLKAFPDDTYDGPKVMGWAKLARNLMIPLGLPVFIIFFGIFRYIWALILAAIGLGLNSAFKGGLTYAALLRLAVVSMTSSMLLSALFSLLDINFGCIEMFLFLGLTFGCFVFGVKMASDARRPIPAFPVEFPNAVPNPNWPQPPQPQQPQPRPPGDDQFP